MEFEYFADGNYRIPTALTVRVKLRTCPVGIDGKMPDIDSALSGWNGGVLSDCVDGWFWFTVKGMCWWPDQCAVVVLT